MSYVETVIQAIAQAAVEAAKVEIVADNKENGRQAIVVVTRP